MRIQHNISAMNAYRNYSNNNSALSKNLEKLSSGYRINRAGDDAAGLAISEKMRAQIAGLDQAQSNAKSGVNLVQTAEGALTEVHDMLNRMTTLADQSANGTYDNTTDRANLQKEVKQLKSEIDRIADASNFNGLNLLDGSMSAHYDTKSLLDDANITNVTNQTKGTSGQAGSFTVDLSDYKVKNDTAADINGTYTMSVGGVDLTVTGDVATSKDGGETKGSDIASAIAAKNTKVTINGVDYAIAASGSKLTFTASSAPKTTQGQETGFDVTMTVAGTGLTKTENWTKKSETVQAGIMATSGTPAQAEFTLTKDMIKDGAQIQIGKQTFTLAIGSNSSYANKENVIKISDDEKLRYDNDTTDKQIVNETAAKISKAAANNADFLVGVKDGGFTILQKSGSSLDLTGTDSIKEQINISETTQDTSKGNSLTLQIGESNASFNKLEVDIQDMHTSSLGIEEIDIGTQSGAQSAIEKIKNAINTVSSVRGTLGATQNRLEHTMNNLSVMSENISDAESTIRDTDVASEMMKYTKNNILIQSAQAMLAQANQTPQGVLQLLQ